MNKFLCQLRYKLWNANQSMLKEDTLEVDIKNVPDTHIKFVVAAAWERAHGTINNDILDITSL